MDGLLFQVGVWSYSLAALGYLVLTLLLVVSWRGQMQGGVLIAVSVLTSVWGAVFAYHAFVGYPFLAWLSYVEIAKHFIWILFFLRLFSLLDQQGSKGVSFAKIRFIAMFVYLDTGFLLIYHTFSISGVSLISGIDVYSASYVVLSVAGLLLVEQFYRNTHPEHRWKIKFLAIGAGSLFAYDLVLYADALLVNHIDQTFWDARGVVTMAVVPLIAISAARNREWSINIFVSRQVVFHTATLVWAGVYLIAVSAGGYYVRTFGGDWGGVAQAALLFGAGIVLVILLFSGHIQAHLKVFLNKHFYKLRYDYRGEWLNLITALSDDASEQSLQKRVMQVLASIVDSKAAIMWMRGSSGAYDEKGSWKTDFAYARVAPGDSLVRYLSETGWVIDIDEYRQDPELYESLVLPEWLENIPTAWLIIPFIYNGELIGFLILTRSLAPRALNWEDRDLLKLAGQQSASYLALEQASEALADARQFEAFNRLSAYVVHDMKNVVGQLSLLTDNAKKFRDNPAFVDDAFITVENAVGKMQRMLAQLRKGRESVHAAKAIKLLPIVTQVVDNRSAYKPVPEVVDSDGTLSLVADTDRLASVIEHVVHNAQDATEDEGWVRVCVRRVDNNAVIEISDSGSGMSAQFIRERLFKPFETTKGNAGMGIGAYECQEFIRSLGGDVLVSSEPGKGSMFRLLMPLTELHDNKNDKL